MTCRSRNRCPLSPDHRLLFVLRLRLFFMPAPFRLRLFPFFEVRFTFLRLFLPFLRFVFPLVLRSNFLAANLSFVEGM